MNGLRPKSARKRCTTIELFKEDQKFSAGHFTIFSKEKRENLHGHNFQVSVALTGCVDDNGMLFDYVFYKDKIREQCRLWNETLLLPQRSPYLRVESDLHEVRCFFADETLRFLPRDVTLLPISNVTLEELSMHFGELLTADLDLLQKDGVFSVEIKISSGPGQWASWNFSTPKFKAASK